MRITFAGGINENASQSINEQECASGRNFELGLNISHFKPRRSFNLFATAPVTTNVTSIMQLVKRSGTVSTLVGAGTAVYTLSSAPAFTSVGAMTAGSKLRDTYWPLDDYLIITDIQKTTVVKKWDGTTYGTLTTGLGTDLYARYGKVWNGRMWLFNVKTTTDTPHLMVASEFEDPTSYDTSARSPQVTSFATGNEAFYMLTPDLRPINGVEVIQNQLVISTESGRLYKLTGTDANDYQWEPFYLGSAAIGTEALVNIGNDVAYLKQGGAIDLLSATQNFGDVRADDLTRWIQTSSSGITDAIAAYDQQRQKVYWFTQNDTGTDGTVFVLFKDILPTGLSPWSIYKTDHASRFLTSAVKYMYKPGTTEYYVFWGDSAGHVFYMDGADEGDGDTADEISTSRTTKLIDADATANVLIGSVRYRRLNEVSLSIKVEWAEDLSESTATVQLKGQTEGSVFVWGGGSYWGAGSYWGSVTTSLRRPSGRSFSHVGYGPAFTVTASVTSEKEFHVDHLEWL